MAGVWPNLDQSDMVARVRTYLNEGTAAFFTDTEIRRWLSYGIKEIAQRSLCIRRILDAKTTASTRTVTVNAYKVLYVEYVPSSGRPIMMAKMDPLKVGHWPLNDTTPHYWYEYGSGIAIEPLPDATYNLRVYVADVPRLVELSFASFTAGTGATEWTAGTGWSGGATAAHTGSTAANFTYNTDLTASKNYTIKFTVTACGTGGTVTPYIGATAGVAVTSVGVHAQNITSPASSPSLKFNANNTLTIDDVYVYREDDFSSTTTEQTELQPAFQHLAVLYATACAMRKDGKTGQAGLLFGVVQSETAYLRQNIVEVIPNGRDDLKYL